MISSVSYLLCESYQDDHVYMHVYEILGLLDLISLFNVQ